MCLHQPRVRAFTQACTSLDHHTVVFPVSFRGFGKLSSDLTQRHKVALLMPSISHTDLGRIKRSPELPLTWKFLFMDCSNKKGPPTYIERAWKQKSPHVAGCCL